MIGLDTSFLVAWAIAEHPDHARCRQMVADTVQKQEVFGLTSGILAEFVHVTKDPRRFSNPLNVEDALAFAKFWAQANEVTL